jgi:hypothetical protein
MEKKQSRIHRSVRVTDVTLLELLHKRDIVRKQEAELTEQIDTLFYKIRDSEKMKVAIEKKKKGDEFAVFRAECDIRKIDKETQSILLQEIKRNKILKNKPFIDITEDMVIKWVEDTLRVTIDNHRDSIIRYYRELIKRESHRETLNPLIMGYSIKEVSILNGVGTHWTKTRISSLTRYFNHCLSRDPNFIVGSISIVGSI